MCGAKTNRFIWKQRKTFAQWQKGKEMRVISVDALSELFEEPIQIFLSRLKLKCPPIIELEQNWISCNDRLPKNDNEVAVALGCNEIASGYYNGEYWYISRDDSEYVTTSENIYGWYPLPELEENMMGGSNVPEQPNVPPMPEEEVKPIINPIEDDSPRHSKTILISYTKEEEFLQALKTLEGLLN
jgi:hypothetical protein